MSTASVMKRGSIGDETDGTLGGLSNMGVGVYDSDCTYCLFIRLSICSFRPFVRALRPFLYVHSFVHPFVRSFTYLF